MQVFFLETRQLRLLHRPSWPIRVSAALASMAEKPADERWAFV
jgi:hypothetical protein